MSKKCARRALAHSNGRHLRFEPLEARRLLATFTVVNTANLGAGSLRQAILDANANPGADNIAFNIGGGGLQTITPLTALPTVNGPTNIDATTQPGFAGSPIIEITGTSAGVTANGFIVSGNNSVVRGLIINNFGANGVSVIGNNIIVAGNWIGLTSDGNGGAGNNNGVVVTGNHNLIGGTKAGDRNVISDSNVRGVLIGSLAGAPNATDNTVSGNYIGLNAAGTAALGNGNDGIRVQNGTAVTNQLPGRNTIGGTAPGAGNVVAASGAEGITIVYHQLHRARQLFGNQRSGHRRL
jgi:Planctomycete extracellular